MIELGQEVGGTNEDEADSALASITVLTACTQQVDPLDAQIQAHIDPEIQGEERAVIARHMRLLKPEDWESVIYIANGKIYVNRVHLKGLIEVAQPWEAISTA